jgi:hypothetical protein
MGDRALRRRCRALLRELGVTPPLDVVDLCRRVGDQRGRPIRLVAHPIPVPGPFGAWISTADADYVLYQRETSRAHQSHIILHELGHVLAGHEADDGDDALMSELYPDIAPDVLRAQYPDLTPDAVRRALRRTSYDSAQEREAETVASIILEWASVVDPVAPRPAEPPPDDPAQRLGTALEERLGWL